MHYHGSEVLQWTVLDLLINSQQNSVAVKLWLQITR